MPMSLALEQKFEQMDKNEDYALQAFTTLRKRFPNQYVGIVEGEVKCSDENLEPLLEKIRADRGSTEGVLILFIPSKRVTIIV